MGCRVGSGWFVCWMKKTLDQTRAVKRDSLYSCPNRISRRNLRSASAAPAPKYHLKPNRQDRIPWSGEDWYLRNEPPRMSVVSSQSQDMSPGGERPSNSGGEYDRKTDSFETGDLKYVSVTPEAVPSPLTMSQSCSEYCVFFR